MFGATLSLETQLASSTSPMLSIKPEHETHSDLAIWNSKDEKTKQRVSMPTKLAGPALFSMCYNKTDHFEACQVYDVSKPLQNPASLSAGSKISLINEGNTCSHQDGI